MGTPECFQCFVFGSLNNNKKNIFRVSKRIKKHDIVCYNNHQEKRQSQFAKGMAKCQRLIFQMQEEQEGQRVE